MRIASALLALSLLLVVVCSCTTSQPEVPCPTVNHFYAKPASISKGDSCTLNWVVDGADEVTIEPGLGKVSASGSRTVSPDKNTVYELIANNSSGATIADTAVTVFAIPLKVDMPVINFFESVPNAVVPGGISTLVWDVTGATSVSIDQGIGAVQAEDRKGVIPSETTKYTITAVNASGEVSAFTNVLVVQNPSTKKPPAELISQYIQMQVNVGKQFTINLDASPEAFKWEMDYYDPDFVSLAGSEYKPYSVPQKGSTGSRQFTFNALKVGATTIKLSYVNNNEPLDSSSKYYKIHISP